MKLSGIVYPELQTTPYNLRSKNMPKEIKQIVLPNKPQLDPLAAYYVLRTYGKDYFTGIDTAQIGIWTKAETPSPEKIKEWEENNILAIDVGGGPFDHHGQKICATNLAINYLGIQDEPLIQNLKQYTQEDDEAGLHNKYGDLAYIIKCMYKQEKEVHEVINYAFTTLDALQAKEHEWHIAAKKEFDEKAKIFKVRRGKRKLKIIVIKSDHIDSANYARQQGAAVVLQQRSSGHTFIFTNKALNIDLKPVIQAIRLREIELQGLDRTKAQNLFKEGKQPLTENWYYHTALNAILNGSDALLDTPATKIPLEEIFQFIINGISTDEPDEPSPLYDNYGFKEYKIKNK